MTEETTGEAPVQVDDPDELAPVELEEVAAEEAVEPPENWGDELGSDDWDERFTGVTIEPDGEEVGA